MWWNTTGVGDKFYFLIRNIKRVLSASCSERVSTSLRKNNLDFFRLLDLKKVEQTIVVGTDTQQESCSKQVDNKEKAATWEVPTIWQEKLRLFFGILSSFPYVLVNIPKTPRY
ncbi:MAG: hypothetical protein AAF757_00580 [Cyanobacteria bacterium P01_D01_bin.116]